ncbi:MAG TPA: hypothetical protein EYM84_02455 [Flavobacteriales bacterium]|nr:hypothetical protein [Flavobacteriales bacterium]
MLYLIEDPFISKIGRTILISKIGRTILFLTFAFFLTSCVIYYKTADIESTIQEFRKAVNNNHASAQKTFNEQEAFFNNFRNRATEEPYASAKKRLETIRSGMQEINRAKLAADNTYEEFKSYSKGKDKIASNTEEWKLFKQTKIKMKASQNEMQGLFDTFSKSAEEYHQYVEESVMPFIRRFNVADYLNTYKEAGDKIAQSQQASLEVVKKNRDVLNGISRNLEDRDIDPYPRLYEQLRLMDRELRQLTRTEQNLRALMREFSLQTKGFTEIWTSFPEWPAIDKLDNQIRALLDGVTDINTACQLHVNQFETIVRKENIGEINAPLMLQKTKNYLDEFNHKVSTLKNELSAASDAMHINRLPSEESKKLYREQLELINQYIVELEGLRSEITVYYNKLDLELRGENMVWIGPGMAAWDAVDALKAITDRVNIFSKKIAKCSRILNNLKK